MKDRPLPAERTSTASTLASTPNAAGKHSQSPAPRSGSSVVLSQALRVLSRLASSSSIDRYRLRKPVEKILYTGTRSGFQAVTAVSRTFSGSRKLSAPSRLKVAGSSDLFDLNPSEEQQMLREAAQSFAAEQLRPMASAADTACAVEDALLRQAADLGLTLIGIPEDLGGVGSERSAVANTLVAEALAQGDMGMAVACLAPSAVSTALVLWGDAQQQSDYLPAFTGSNIPAAALAIVEPRPLFDPFRLETRARLTNEGYVLEGVKSMVPRAAQAELFLIGADLEGHGPALFLVESSTPGLIVEREPAMGLRAAATGRLLMQNVKLPASARLGAADATKPHAGDADLYAQCIQLSRIGWCALAVGTGQAVLDHLIPYVNERVAFGEPISHRQGVAFTVANVAIELESMRLLTLRAASLAERGKPYFQQAALARRLCAEKGMLIGSDGVQMLGGHGFTKEYPVERWYRDLRAVGVMEGAILV
jgi:alkylation response protein AidB-like acyl-CoA dehydrogenase